VRRSECQDYHTHCKDGERLTTLDGVDRKLTSTNVLVCDEKGPLSLAGVMGGAETEVYDASEEVLDAVTPESKPGEMQRGKASVRGVSTANILLEGAAWNFINIRKTAHCTFRYRSAFGVHLPRGGE
jgi:phenylalanyl-tRNA synthetase beta subunit